MWPLFDALPMVPLALLRGANSGLISPATAAAMSARRPDLVVTVVADRGHVPFLDEPEAVAAIAAFLARVAA
jgi:pimeloyl-ACP methyl ester carboxylesterase